jgi:copper homeostasis protein
MLEVIALDADDARAAQAGGADRLELVADMDADGLTPGRETFAAVRSAVDLPVRVMLRAADGFSAGGPQDVAALCARAAELRREGADEFVLGFLDEAGQPDVEAAGAVVEAIDGSPWTFHRAIDRAADRDGLRKRLGGGHAPAELPGPDAFLTAGSAAGVDDGWDVLVAEAARTAAGEPGYAPLLMVGGGLRLEHVPGLREAGVTAFHIGGAARPGGWSAPVEREAVARWRTLLDA